MKKILKFILIRFISTLAILLTSLVVLLSLIAIFLDLETKITISPDSVLQLTIDHPVTERNAENIFEQLIFSKISESNLGLNDILANIRTAKSDDRIKGILIRKSTGLPGKASTEAIRDALIDFKKSGKFVIAYSEHYTQNSYYLASIADEIYMHPQGVFEFQGFNVQIAFFKGALDRLGIDPQVIRAGTYKSAVEPYIRGTMSQASRTQLNAYLHAVQDHFLQEIAKSRKMPQSTLKNIVRQLYIRHPKDALKHQLIDGLKFEDEVLAILKARIGIKKKEELHSVTLQDYIHSEKKSDKKKKKKMQSSGSEDRITVIYTAGTIAGVMEENTENPYAEARIDAQTLSKIIHQVRLDDQVKAVVLRINSPGGCALASDVIWRAVMLTQKVKPVIVSMGDKAASGGYYIACAADSIFAAPNTITGSIGVFAIFPNLKRFFNKKLNITFDGSKTDPFADLGSMTRPMSALESSIVQEQVNKVYAQFIQVVAQGRKKSVKYIDSIAQGRVWTGKQAMTLGLVDRLGHTADAIKSAAKKANITDYEIEEYPKKEGIWGAIRGKGFLNKAKAYLLREKLGFGYRYYQQVKAISKMQGIQARLPYDMLVDP